MEPRSREALVWGVVLAICGAVILFVIGLLVLKALDSGA
jgi:choline-glycine betaine transporter